MAPPDDEGKGEPPTHKTLPGFPAMAREPAPPDDRGDVAEDDDTFLSSELEEVWPFLSIEERVEGFRILTRADAEDLFDRLSAADQARLIPRGSALVGRGDVLRLAPCASTS